jgi:hypothetical protein
MSLKIKELCLKMVKITFLEHLRLLPSLFQTFFAGKWHI